MHGSAARRKGHNSSGTGPACSYNNPHIRAVGRGHHSAGVGLVGLLAPEQCPYGGLVRVRRVDTVRGGNVQQVVHQLYGGPARLPWKFHRVKFDR